MKYGRLSVFIICTLLSSLALLATFSMLVKGELKPDSWLASSENIGLITHWSLFAWTYISLYAWIAYFAMSVYWIRNKRINSLFMKSGYVSGLLAAGFVLFIFTPAIIFALPAIILASYLVGFHSNANKPTIVYKALM